MASIVERQLLEERVVDVTMNTLTRRRHVSTINSSCESSFEAAGPELEVGHDQDEFDDGSIVPESPTELSSPEVSIETQAIFLDKVYDGVRECFPELSFVMSRVSANRSDSFHVPLASDSCLPIARMEWFHRFKFTCSIKLMLFMF